jgi:phosphoglycerol transferase MdoB-like AlkP superfamily enzyme
MKPEANKYKRTCGFRFSKTDAAVLVLVGLAASLLWLVEAYELVLLVLFTVLHFFLFCNVFRIKRKPELIWSGFFVINSLVSFNIDEYPFALVCALQLVVTVILILHEIRQPYYHGVASRRLNSKYIHQYLEGNI